ncbi:MAG: hypothetical protein AABZ47_12915 [Planctomycetota bacterium]
MTYRARVKNGSLILDPPIALPDGCEVEVTVIEKEAIPPTWGQVFKDLIGKAQELPPDSSLNHDHYLYGVPKK